MSELIKMRRATPQHEGGPVTADVHRDEVSAYLQVDWEIETSEVSAESSSASEPQRRGGRRKQAETSEAPAGDSLQS